jgi:hypothetical protein
MVSDLKATLYYLMLISLTIFVARAQPGFAGGRHRGAARYRGPSTHCPPRMGKLFPLSAIRHIFESTSQLAETTNVCVSQDRLLI